MCKDIEYLLKKDLEVSGHFKHEYTNESRIWFKTKYDNFKEIK